jgi:hypothetical protein
MLSGDEASSILEGYTEQNLVARDLCFSVKGYKYFKKFTSCKVVSAHPTGKFGLEQCPPPPCIAVSKFTSYWHPS